MDLSEFIAAMQQREQYDHMAAEDRKNRIEGLFDDLPLEQLVSLRMMLTAICANINYSDKPDFAAYYAGMATSVLKIKHGVCPDCGKDHATEVLEETDSHKEPTMSDQPINTPAGDELSTYEGNPASYDTELDRFREMTPEEKDLMKQYHLDDARIEGTNELVGFICTGIEGGPVGGCGIIYQSIEDRMLRDPEYCSGCFARAAQG